MQIKTILLRTVLLATIPLATSCQRVGAAPPQIEEQLPDTNEPITGEPAKPNPGDETKVKDPFEPYGIGPPEHAIARDQLSAREQAAVDRTKNADATTLASYRRAVLQQSARITAEIAARQLGTDNLKSVGVVP